MQEDLGQPERESAAQLRSPIIRATDILIAARREAERILREAEQRANDVLQNAPDRTPPALPSVPPQAAPAIPPQAGDLSRYLSQISTELNQLGREREEILGRIEDMGRSIASAIREEMAQLRDVLAPAQRVEEPAVSPRPSTRRSAAREELFRPGRGRQLHLNIANIGAFADLSGIHAALIALPELDDVTIARYEGGEAELLIDFHDPLRATDIVDALAQGGFQAAVEQSQADARTLRLTLQA